MKKLKIRTKITLLYLLFSVFLLLVLMPTVYTNVSHSLNQTLRARLQMSISGALTALDMVDGQLDLDPEDMDIPNGIALAVFETDGEMLYENTHWEWNAIPMTPDEVNTVTVNGRKWMTLCQDCEVRERELTITAVSSMGYVEESLNNLSIMLSFLMPVYLGASALGAFFLAKNAMRPIKDITQTALAIGDGDISTRIQGIDTRDEVGELAMTFNMMLDNVERSFKRERQFTSDASHELRTPISIISACAEDALMGDAAGGCCGDMETVKTEADRMTKIITQLLMLSRGYEGRYHFVPDQIELHDMVESVSEELSEPAESMEITVHNEVDVSTVITADQSLMTQMFINLISNSIKYGHMGGNVWVEARNLEDVIEISVSDDGIGIPAEDQPHIFERFYRADKARDRNGTGLGLAIVKWIVELHHGDIHVKSSVGHGTIFNITLPGKTA